MSDREIRTAASAPVRNWWLWLQMLGVVSLGGFLLLVISLRLDSEDQSPAPRGTYLIWALLHVAVALCTYLVVRRSTSKEVAVLAALLALPACWVVAGLMLLFAALVVF